MNSNQCRCVSVAGDISSVVCPIHSEKSAVPDAREAQSAPTDQELDMRALAEALRDVIQDTEEPEEGETPEDTYVNLAARLVARLQRTHISVLPKHCGAAARIMEIFTDWLKKNPESNYVTDINPTSKKFEITLIDEDGVAKAFFRGESVQDAYAQAAHVVQSCGDEI